MFREFRLQLSRLASCSLLSIPSSWGSYWIPSPAWQTGGETNALPCRLCREGAVSFSWSSRRLIMGQFLSFSVVGALGFLVDVTVLSLALIGGLGLYTGRVVSYLAAATFTWYCNSKVTFRSTNVGLKLECFRFVLWNIVGGAVNYSVYALLIAQNGLFAGKPALAVAVGSLAGLAINFLVSRLLVFRSQPNWSRDEHEI